MEAFWTLGIVALAFVNVVFLVLLLALTRQLGLILVRLGPTVARETVDTLAVGSTLAPAVLMDVKGTTHRIEPVKYGHTLLVFVAPACEACRDLVKGLRTFAHQYVHDVRTLVVSTAEPSQFDEHYAVQLEPRVVPYVRDRAFAGRLGVKATPYAVLLDAANKVVSKGIVNSLEQLESLIVVEATALRTASNTGEIVSREQLEVTNERS